MRRLISASAVAALALMLVPAAGAARPLEIVHAVDKELGVEELPSLGIFSEVCGLELTATLKGTFTFILFDDFSGQLHLSNRITIVNPATGKAVLEDERLNAFFSEPLVTVDEQAGTVTIVHTRRLVGIPVRWKEPNGGVLLLDAGIVVLVVTEVIDLATGDLIAIDVNAERTNGPHPNLESGASFEPLCDALS